ncbi:MAG: ABC transporter substrate-binding protein, partial [Gammaproteobacteria bacterium]|nr:ABC transporter substrate-binding protein [Gammaproteobacteria bacterium]
SGEANMALGLYPEELMRFEGRPEFTTHRVRGNHSTLELNWAEPPFDDQKVRQAVCYALPYERILDRVYGGYARRSHSPICSSSEFH